MWIFTDMADYWDEGEARTQETIGEWAVSAGPTDSKMANVARGGLAVVSAGFTYLKHYVVDALRIGDGLKKGTLMGAYEDLGRFLTVVPAAKIAGKALGTVHAKALQGVAVSGVKKSATLRALSSKVEFVIRNNKVYARLSDVCKLTQHAAIMARMHSTYKVWQLRDMMQRLGILRASGINALDLRHFVRVLPKDGAVFANITITNARHTYKTTVVVSKNFRDRLIVKSDRGVYGSLEKWLKAEHPSVRAVTVNYADVAEGVKFNNELKQAALSIFVQIQGVAINGDFDRALEAMQNTEIYKVGND